MSATKPARRDRLQAAADLIAAAKRAGEPPRDTISRLVDGHGAVHRCDRDPHTLRIAGLMVSCTWSKDVGLLDAWTRRVTLELLKLDGRAS